MQQFGVAATHKSIQFGTFSNKRRHSGPDPGNIQKPNTAKLIIKFRKNDKLTACCSA